MRTSPNLHESLELSGWIFAKKLKSVKILKNFTHATVHVYTSNLFKLFVVFFSLTLGFVGDGFLSFWGLWISFFPVWCLRGRVCLLVVSYNVDTKCLIVSFQSKYRGCINQYNTMVTSCAHSKPEPGISIKFYHCFLCIKVFREFMKNDSKPEPGISIKFYQFSLYKSI